MARAVVGSTRIGRKATDVDALVETARETPAAAPAAQALTRPPGSHGALAAAMRAQRRPLALALMASVADWDKYQGAIAACGPDKTPFLSMEIQAFVDYLIRYFETGDENYRHLYVGEKLKQLYVGGTSDTDAQARKELVTRRDMQGMLAVLRDSMAAPELALFESMMLDITRVLISSSRHTAQLLMIGDCLHLDVMGFLASSCLSDDIAIRPTFVPDKNPIQVRQSLKELAGGSQPFDLALFSPFTYAFSTGYAQLLNSNYAAESRRAIAAVVLEAWKETETTLNLLGDLLECNIVVHNSSNILRHGNALWERVKHGLTRRTRQLGRNLMNEHLAAYIAKKNAESFEHFLLLDEVALAAPQGEFAMGRYFYHSQLQHPAMMGKAVAEAYRDLVFVHKRLLKKKLVVCDLDNTLWAGVIGEGPVRHHLDRQESLMRLRQKGVVLAVNSKNDPKNVTWAGAALSEVDFVNLQINWEPKVRNFSRIKEALNLGYKDYVFLDDRADERALVNGVYPEILAMDPEDARTWKLVELWARTLPAQGEADRTQFYKSRETRIQFLQENGLQEEDVSAAFAALGITVAIRRAGRGDLKRVAELVNRTNQFNMQGSRTTLREMQSWHGDESWRIFIADAGDKFGTMGTVSVLVCQQFGDKIEIPIFVLSCRVFGYGIETALLNHVKRQAGGRQVVGLFQETPSNAPCRETYRKNGFAAEGGRWVFSGETGADPGWLTVAVE